MRRLVLFMLCLTTSVANAQFRFAEKLEQEGASCTAVDIVDKNNKVVAVPEKIRLFLNCPQFLSIRKSMLVYMDAASVKLYDINTGSERTLFLLPDSIDGVSGPAWGPGADRLMFVIINQEKRYGYTENCRIIHLQLDAAGNVLRKLKYDRPVQFTCGSICTAGPGKDFMYLKNGRTIRYKIHEAAGQKATYGQIVLP